MTFLKPQHLFEVYLFESTKKNAFSIMNSEPTSTIRKKIYADRYEISSGGLTFYQTMKNASDELEDVPVVSFPAGKWESVNLIRNRIIIAEHKTGASTGASHISIQPELKKNKPATSNSFKIIQMPPNGKETEKELVEVNKLLEHVNNLVEKQSAIFANGYLPPSKLVSQVFEESSPITEVKKPSSATVPKTTQEKAKETPVPVSVITPEPKKQKNDPVIATPQQEEKTKYTQEELQSVDETEQTEVSESSNLWDDLNQADALIESEDNVEPEPVIHSVDQSFDDFSIDIDEITAALSDNNDFIGEEVKVPDSESISIKMNGPTSSTAPAVEQEKPAERKPAPKPKENPEPELSFEDSDNIMGLLDTLSDDNAYSQKDLKEKKKEFINENLTTYLKVAEIFRFDHFCSYLQGEEGYSKTGVKEHDVQWEIAQLILQQGVSPRKFIKEKLQKHIALILPSIMKKHWDGSIISILDLAKGHNEIKDITLIDLSVWMAQNGYK